MNKLTVLMLVVTSFFQTMQAQYKNIELINERPRDVYEFPLRGSEETTVGIIKLRYEGSVLRKAILQPFDEEQVILNDIIESAFFYYNEENRRIYNLKQENQYAPFSHLYMDAIYDMKGQQVSKLEQDSKTLIC